MEYNQLILFVGLLWVIVIVGFINKKYTKLPSEIALLLSSIAIGILIIFIEMIFNFSIFSDLIPLSTIDDFLVHGFLCFMLFAGACDLYLKRLLPSFKLILVLAIITTLLGAIIYGLLAYGILYVLGIHTLSLIECFMFGCIVAPTDPIAAMSILKKAGLSKELAIIIEGESLFNDGVGLALFVVVSSSIESGNTSVNPLAFLSTLSFEVVGALVIGLLVSSISLYLFKRTKDCFMQIFISLLAVSSAYVLCQKIGVSGAIASVICGIVYASIIEKNQEKPNNRILDMTIYQDFWAVIQDLLNSTLYVLLGITFIHIYRYTTFNEIVILIAIISNFLARYISVLIPTAIFKVRPKDLSLFKFTNLLTYAGIKGALSLALAITTIDIVDENVFHSILIATFAIVIFTTVIQGLTIGKFYKRNY